MKLSRQQACLLIHEKERRMRFRISVVLGIILLCLIVGCGSGLHPTTSSFGRASFTMIWPRQGRLIPAASNSIVVQILSGTTRIATQTLARPASGGAASATFNTLPVGSLTATATAY